MRPQWWVGHVLRWGRCGVAGEHKTSQIPSSQTGKNPISVKMEEERGIPLLYALTSPGLSLLCPWGTQKVKKLCCPQELGRTPASFLTELPPGVHTYKFTHTLLLPRAPTRSVPQLPLAPVRVDGRRDRQSPELTHTPHHPHPRSVSST